MLTAKECVVKKEEVDCGDQVPTNLADEAIMDLGLLSDGAAPLKVMLLVVLFAPLLVMEGLRILFRR